MTDLIDWLLEGPPWVVYHTRLDLLNEPADGSEVVSARESMIAHGQIQALLTELSDWPWPLLKSHKTAGHPLHKLVFLADLGLRIDDPGVGQVVERILGHQSDEGPFQILVNISPGYGGSGEDQWAWMLCDAPLLVYALSRFGMRDDPRVRAAIEHLVGLVRENGWPCAVTSELGKFRGPGRKTDPCPYANLVMLQVLAEVPGFHGDDAARIGAGSLLALWEQRRERRPYLFAMGTHFARLKAPLVWYDILHVTEVLSRFAWLHEDRRLREMTTLVRDKADESGRYTAESVWRDWKAFDFGQKRTPSRWLTLLVLRMLRRVEPQNLADGPRDAGLSAVGGDQSIS